MANTLSVTWSVVNNDNGHTVQATSGGGPFTITRSGTLLQTIKKSVATGSETAFAVDSGITGGSNKAGLIVIYNRDATNFVRIGLATTVYPMSLGPGESMILHSTENHATDTPISNIYARADTAACDVEMHVFER